MMKFSLVCVSFLCGILACQADTVRLQINGPDGKAVVGAKVRVIEGKGRQFSNFAPPRDFQSDAEGVVAFESLSDMATATAPNDTSKSYLSARVLAPGLAVGTIPLKAGDNKMTLALGQTLEGVTLDMNEKPLAGVGLVIGSIRGTKKYIYLPESLGLEASSDAQGHWKFEGMPLEGEAQIQIRDARFKGEAFTLDLTQKAPLLFLEPGMGIKGRLLRPDGTPASNVRIYTGDMGHQPTTDAEGRFEAMGLSDPQLYLQIVGNDQKLPFIVKPQQVDDLEMGEVRDIGDWKTIEGVHLKGKLIDAQSKQPIANASISSYGIGSSVNDQSDKEGNFDLLVAPGQQTLSVRAPGFVTLPQKSVSAPKTGGTDVGAIPLQRGFKLSGVAVDETGAPMKNVSLYVEKNWNREYGRTDFKDGTFTINSLEKGDYTVKATGFKIVSGATVSVGGDATAPLRVVLQGKAGGQTGDNPVIAGRVVDGEGHPLAGAKIALQLQTKDGSSQSPKTISQSDGSFKTTGYLAGATLRVLSVVRPGYVRSKEQLDSNDKGWNVELTLQKRGLVLKGRVVNTQGQPVANAFVGVQNAEDLPVPTNANGEFSLLDVLQSGVTLLVSDGPSLTTFSIEKAGGDVKIVLPDAPPAEDEVTLADKLLQDGALDDEWRDNWALLGTKRTETLFRKSALGRAWGQYLEELAHREPRDFIARESELKAVTPTTNEAQVQRVRMLAYATAGDATQKAQVNVWLDEQEKERRDISMQSMMQMLYVAEIAARLDSKKGAQWLDDVLQFAEQLDIKQGGENAWELGRLAARVAPNGPQTLSQTWTPKAQMQLLLIAMQTWRNDHNLDAAKGGWEKLKLLAAQEDKNPVQPIGEEDYYQQPGSLMNQARGEYASLLMESDIKAALDLVMALDNSPGTDPYSNKRQYLLNIARAAARQKQFDVARVAVNTLAATKRIGADSLAGAAQVAQEFDPALAMMLWSRAALKSVTNSGNSWMRRDISYAPYARTRALKWPGESRILIEREWQRRMQDNNQPVVEGEEDFFHSDSDSLTALVGAMAWVAPARAIEMLESVQKPASFRPQARTAVALALLKSAQG